MPKENEYGELTSACQKSLYYGYTRAEHVSLYIEGLITSDHESLNDQVQQG